MKGLRIVGDGSVANTRVFDKDGKDITRDIGCRGVYFAHAVGELPMVLLDCIGATIEIEGSVVIVPDGEGRGLLAAGELLARKRLEQQLVRHAEQIHTLLNDLARYRAALDDMGWVDPHAASGSI